MAYPGDQGRGPGGGAAAGGTSAGDCRGCPGFSGDDGVRRGFRRAGRTIDVGPSAVHGWEKGSLQTYTDAAENVRLDGQGHLAITARRDADSYTSGRVVTRGKLAFGLGTLVARIKFPSGQGLWPAFWMLGANIEAVGWPQCGEIDVMELINDASTYHVALHAPGADPEASGPIADLSTDFHNYWVTRTANKVTIGVDATVLASFDPSVLPPGSPWVFDEPMFVLLNLAVGGTWPGPPDDSTPFPATMLVDRLQFVPLA
jgi:beta-glucanase (GH16 family)